MNGDGRSQRERILEAIDAGAETSLQIGLTTGLSVRHVTAWLAQLATVGEVERCGTVRPPDGGRACLRWCRGHGVPLGVPAMDQVLEEPRPDPTRPPPIVRVLNGVEFEVVFSGRESLTPPLDGLGSSLAGREYSVRR